jgi:hypothetical protein
MRKELLLLYLAAVKGSEMRIEKGDRVGLGRAWIPLINSEKICASGSLPDHNMAPEQLSQLLSERWTEEGERRGS